MTQSGTKLCSSWARILSTTRPRLEMWLQRMFSSCLPLILWTKIEEMNTWQRSKIQNSSWHLVNWWCVSVVRRFKCWWLNIDHILHFESLTLYNLNNQIVTTISNSEFPSFIYFFHPGLAHKEIGLMETILFQIAYFTHGHGWYYLVAAEYWNHQNNLHQESLNHHVNSLLFWLHSRFRLNIDILTKQFGFYGNQRW